MQEIQHFEPFDESLKADIANADEGNLEISLISRLEEDIEKGKAHLVELQSAEAEQKQKLEDANKAYREALANNQSIDEYSKNHEAFLTLSAQADTYAGLEAKLRRQEEAELILREGNHVEEESKQVDKIQAELNIAKKDLALSVQAFDLANQEYSKVLPELKNRWDELKTDAASIEETLKVALDYENRKKSTEILQNSVATEKDALSKVEVSIKTKTEQYQALRQTHADEDLVLRLGDGLEPGYAPLETGLAVLELHGPCGLGARLVDGADHVVHLGDVHTCVDHGRLPPFAAGSCFRTRDRNLLEEIRGMAQSHPHPAYPRPRPDGAGCQTPLREARLSPKWSATLPARICIASISIR